MDGSATIGIGRTGERGHASDVVYVRAGDREPVPLLFWTEGPCLYVAATGRSSRWSVDALRAGRCEVAVRGGVRRSYRASLVTDPRESERVRDGLRAKYGEVVWSRYFGPPERYVRLDPELSAERPGAADLVAQEFDAVAPTYTAGVERRPVERYLKDRARSWLIERLDGLDPVLEIGPGTGLDTLPLLRTGHRVVAVDVSLGMLRQLDAEARTLGVADRLVVVHAPMRELGTVLDRFGPGGFGAAFSTFGAFNLEEEIRPAVRALERAIRPGGRLAFTTLNRGGIAPVLWELAARNPVGAAARMGDTVPAGEIRYPLDVHLRGARFWDRTLAPGFERELARPVSLLAPPFDSPRLLRWLGTRGAQNLRDLDRALSRAPALVPLAEWAFLSYRRTAAVPVTSPGGR